MGMKKLEVRSVAMVSLVSLAFLGSVSVDGLASGGILDTLENVFSGEEKEESKQEETESGEGQKAQKQKTAGDREDQQEQPDKAAEDGGEQEGKGELKPEPQELEEEERIRRQEAKIRAEHLVVEANRAFRENEYENALKKYKDAKEALDRAGDTKEIQGKKKRVDDYLYNVRVEYAKKLASEARRYADVEQFGKALNTLKKAGEIKPGKREEIDRLRKKFRQQRKEARMRADVDEDEVMPDQEQKSYDINVLMQEGKMLFENHEYERAESKFKKVLVKNPYHTKAMRWLRKINEELKETAAKRKESTLAKRMAQVRWKWQEPVTTMEAGAPEAEGGETPVSKEGGLRQKLQNIVIPKINFDSARVPDVIRFLQDKSKDLDEEGQGVNFMLRLSQQDAGGSGSGETAPSGGSGTGGPGGGEEFGGFGDEDLEEFEGGGGDSGADAAESRAQVPKVTMNMQQVPLAEVIRYICTAADLQYVVETNAVIIAGKDVPLERMETRTYSVKAGVLTGGGEGSGELSMGDGGDSGDGGFFSGDDDSDGDGGGGGALGGGGMSSEELKSFFDNFGVNFPEGSRVGYFSKRSKLMVHNTPENLRKIEKVLEEINVTPRQVSIEAKFVEVNQTDLENLGFEWTFRPSDHTQNTWSVLGDSLEVEKQVPGGGPRLTKALRGTHEILPGVDQGSDSLLSLSGILGNVEYNTLIHALDRQDSTDILSAPKVTAMSGEQAAIGVVTQRFFPEDFTEPEIVDTETGTSVIPSTPEFGDETDIGVMLEVTPRVGPDGYTIYLQLSPNVREFIGYDRSFNYDLQVAGSTTTVKQMKPILSERRVNTRVIVWDGETVVLGGLIKEDVTTYKDKVPLLGELPVIGRLFTNTGEESNKRNLLVFVTARLVDPAGAPLRGTEMRGLPDFQR